MKYHGGTGGFGQRNYRYSIRLAGVVRAMTRETSRASLFLSHQTSQILQHSSSIQPKGLGQISKVDISRQDLRTIHPRGGKNYCIEETRLSGTRWQPPRVRNHFGMRLPRFQGYHLIDRNDLRAFVNGPKSTLDRFLFGSFAKVLSRNF